MSLRRAPKWIAAAVVIIGGWQLPIAGAQLTPAATPGLEPKTVVPATPTLPTAAPTASSPSMDELQSDLDQKKYPAAVKLASKLLAIRGPEAATLSRFQITMLKGEAQVGMKSLSAAAVTFKSAEKETKDPHELALAKWTGELFARAKGTTYVPKAVSAGLEPAAPIDLMDHDKRKEAFGAMLEDDLSVLSPKLKTAAVTQSLPQIWPVLQQVISLDQLDEIANGNDDRTGQVAGSLLEHSRNLLSNALKGMWARVGDIDTHANIVTQTPSTSVINGAYVTQTISKKNGLSDPNKKELSDNITTCQKIHEAAEVFMPLDKTDKNWGDILNDADRVAGRSSDVLNADYGGVVSDTNTNFNNGGLGVSTDGSQPVYPGGGTSPVTPQQPTKRPTAPSKPITTKGN